MSRALLFTILLLGAGYALVQFRGYAWQADGVRQEKVSELGKYKWLKDVLINNSAYLASRYPVNDDQECSGQLVFSAGNISYWIGWEREHPDLSELESYHREGLLYQVSIFDNQSVHFKSVFRGRSWNGEFFHHHIVNEPDADNTEQRPFRCPAKLHSVKAIEKNWFYVVEQI